MKTKDNFVLLVTFIGLAIIFFAIILPESAGGTPKEKIENEEYIPEQPYWRDRTLALEGVIVQLESGGIGDCFDIPGASGEIGCHQFLPSTWNAYSIEVYGEVLEQTPENAEYVVRSMIEKWIEKGYSDRDIFLIWNQGNRGDCREGINRHGVAFNSCAYAEKALEMLENFIPIW